MPTRPAWPRWSSWSPKKQKHLFGHGVFVLAPSALRDFVRTRLLSACVRLPNDFLTNATDSILSSIRIGLLCRLSMVLRPTTTVSSYVFGKEFSYGIWYWYAGFLGWLIWARVYSIQATGGRKHSIASAKKKRSRWVFEGVMFAI